ncbi:MAG: carbohydrate ABC transporter substrate-binding protein, partial [Oscillospiraceae bacterium]|nr:carbohydrate ABC transporter substrate-binding protein [Oscillospiraceae bacterium]
MGNLYPGDAEKELLVEFTKMYGPYYNTMDGFANMRAQWFDMLQKITGGGDVTELANAAVEASNAGMAG